MLLACRDGETHDAAPAFDEHLLEMEVVGGPANKQNDRCCNERTAPVIETAASQPQHEYDQGNDEAPVKVSDQTVFLQQ